MQEASNKKIHTFSEFYPFYLNEHSNKYNRRLHFIGTTLVIFCILSAIANHSWFNLMYAPIFGYGFAWIGHFFIEKNKPASFKQPFFSFCGDWVMYKDLLSGRIPF